MGLVRFIVRLVIFMVLVAGVVWFLAARAPYPEQYQYGVSFNTLYADELGLEWEEVYVAILEDLGVRHLRLAAHWPMVSPEEGEWNFTELDRQLELAAQYDAEVVFALGRRLPRWPECHVPGWAAQKSWEEQQELIIEYITEVVERYKDKETIRYWQVENEPFLTVYAVEECGDLDKAFLDRELALVRELDPSRPVFVTDSGNLGTWYGAYSRGDAFGTSVYVHLWNETTGPIETLLPPEAYVAKRKAMELVFGEKETMLIELSVEPWLNLPVVETELAVQLERMNLEKFEEILSYARETRLAKQYLWGAEWWYWLKETQEHPEMWERARELYSGAEDVFELPSSE
jgi:hypothetical protein